MIQDITFKEFSDYIDKVVAFGNNRKPYTIAIHRSLPADKVLKGDFLINSYELLDLKTFLLDRNDPVIVVSFIDMQPTDLMLCDEVITEVDAKFNNVFEMFEKHAYNSLGVDYAVYTKRHLTNVNMLCYDVNDVSKIAFETIANDPDCPWQPYHVAHLHLQSKLLLQVIWDRREIVAVHELSNDDITLIMDMTNANDNMQRYFAHKHLESKLASIEHSINAYIV